MEASASGWTRRTNAKGYVYETNDQGEVRWVSEAVLDEEVRFTSIALSISGVTAGSDYTPWDLLKVLYPKFNRIAQFNL